MPLLETDRLLLRPPERGDAAKIAKWLGDFDVARNTASVPHPFTLTDAEAMLAMADEKRATGEMFQFAVVHKTTGILIGCCSLSLHRGTYELSYWLGRVFWNQGYGTEAARRVAGFAFHDLKAETITAHWLDDNPGSWHVLDKLGFARGGSFETVSAALGEKVLCHKAILHREAFGRKRHTVVRHRPVTASLGA